jgi:Chalcone-flavanone isomerase
VEKLFRVVVIKEIKGSQYGVQLESSVRDRLAACDKYEEEEEEALEKVTEFFQSKYFKKDSVVTFSFPTSGKAEVCASISKLNYIFNYALFVEDKFAGVQYIKCCMLNFCCWCRYPS